MPPTSTAAPDFLECGYRTLPSVFSRAECARMVELLDGYWASVGSPELSGFGLGIHPMLQKVPEMAEFCAREEIIDALREVLGDEPRLMHSGVRVSDEKSGERLGWHEHYEWDKSAITRRTRPERVLFGCYVRGSIEETGPLIVLPRRVNDPIQPPLGGPHDDWPGQVDVIVPPGSVVIFDTALYHTARRGTKPGRRYLWGTHCQGVKETRPHREDNSSEHPLVAAYKQKDARLRRFIDGR